MWPLALPNGVTVTAGSKLSQSSEVHARFRATRSLAAMPCYSMGCELLEVKEVKSWKALTSAQANGARKTGVTPKNPAVRSSLLWARFLLSCPVALFFAGFPGPLRFHSPHLTSPHHTLFELEHSRRKGSDRLHTTTPPHQH